MNGRGSRPIDVRQAGERVRPVISAGCAPIARCNLVVIAVEGCGIANVHLHIFAALVTSIMAFDR